MYGLGRTLGLSRTVCTSAGGELLPYHSHAFFLSFCWFEYHYHASFLCLSSFQYYVALCTFPPPLVVVEKRDGGHWLLRRGTVASTKEVDGG